MGRSHLAPALAAVLIAAACSPAVEPTPGASTTTPAPSPSDYGTRYVLPERLCDVTDFTEFLELYTNENQDSVLRNNSPERCETSFVNDARNRGLGISLWVTVIEDDLLAASPTLTREEFDSRVRDAIHEPTAVEGVGSGAVWYGDDDQLWFDVYDGNLNLRLFVFTAFARETLPPDMPERVVAVAQSTLHSLAP